MKINNQSFELTSKYLILRLDAPYFNAWARYGWPEGIQGYSISKKAVEKALELKKKLLVKYKGDYEITVSKALRYSGNEFTARDGTILICIPSTAFTRLPDPVEQTPVVGFETKLKLKDIWLEVAKAKGLI